ncbi:hypothetical protein AX14_005640 [Amanita brunnescens Koide BX004]|nr:hypothetical protein AX14_005640 [Amanita brunnescens Koide BX004]
MAEGKKTINCRGRRTCMIFCPYAVCKYSPARKILEVAEGIEYIHSEGVVHGDLRGANVLLDANLHVKIADFGLTRVLEATNSRSRTRHFNFAAPELFGIDDDEDFEPIRTQKSDVYAFGCLYYEIHHDAMPFAGKTEMIIVKHHAQGLHPRRLQEPPLSDEAWELIRSCWTRKPSDRPGIEEVTEKMVAISQSVVSTPASSTRALESGTPSLLNELVEHTLQSPTPRAPLCPTNALGPPLVRPSMHSASWMPATCSPLSATAGAQGPSYPGAPLLPPNGAGLPYKLSTQPSPRTQPKAPGIEGVMEMVTRCSLSCPDPAICNSLGIHLAHLSTSPAQSPSTSSPTSSFKTPASSFTPASPPNSRHNSWLPVEQRSQLRRQSGSAIIAQDPSYGMPPGAPRSASPLSATLKASLEYYSSPKFGNLGFQFPTAQQSDECTDVLTVWQNVTLNPSFKDADLNRLYNEVISRAKYDGTKIVLKTDDVLRISLAFTIEW